MKLTRPILNEQWLPEYTNLSLSLAISERIINDEINTSVAMTFIPYSDNMVELKDQPIYKTVTNWTQDIDDQTLVEEIKTAVQKFLVVKWL